MKKRLQQYRDMLLIRCFEERVEWLFARGKVKGTVHPAIGQEAIAVGVDAALQRRDYVTSTHRGHGHFLARGGDPRRIMAELFGKRTGYSGGRGGSQLMADIRVGFLGANGITGGSLPLATGVALSAKLRGTGKIATCFFGDGAACQGTFHEALNMAGLWDLPVIYVCENNQYAMSTPVSEAVAICNIADRAGGYGMPGVVVDGNDLDAVRKAMTTAVKRARAGEGPTLVECKTYRLSGHSRGDPCVYRTREEEAEWRGRDPIVRFRKVLKQEGVLSAETDKTIRREVRDVVRDAEQFARTSPYPDPASLETGVYA